MKHATRFLILSLVALMGLLFTGCASTNQSNAGALLSKVAKLNISAADVQQSTDTPIFSHSEKISGITRTADGAITITNLAADFSIPVPGVKWHFSASSISVSKEALPAVPATLSDPADTPPPPTAKADETTAPTK